jgi:membrane protein DedA with SNARE-associated domain
MDLAILFVSAFAASTILPMSSEVVLGALAVAGTTEVWMLFVVATAGNTLGAVANWALGRYVATWRTRLVSLNEAKFQRASRWFNRWGIWCLLLRPYVRGLELKGPVSGMPVPRVAPDRPAASLRYRRWAAWNLPHSSDWTCISGRPR